MHTLKTTSLPYPPIKGWLSLTKLLVASCLLLGFTLSVSVKAHEDGEKKLAGHDAIFIPGYYSSPSEPGEAPLGLMPEPLGDHVEFGFGFSQDKHIDDGCESERDNCGAGREFYNYLTAVDEQTGKVQKKKCIDSCILVTASTGDLIARYFIENQKMWAEEDGIEPFNIIATIDFVGAGGGVEGASILNFIPDTLRQIAEANDIPFDEELTLGDKVLNDLNIDNARGMANNFSSHRVPRFRISARWMGPGFHHLLIYPAANDGIVSAHSSCGMNSHFKGWWINSCDEDVGYDGITDYASDLPFNLFEEWVNSLFGQWIDFDIPRPSDWYIRGPKDVGAGLWDYHYPVIMAGGIHNHGSIGMRGFTQGPITYIDKQRFEGGVGFDFNTKVKEHKVPILVWKDKCEKVWYWSFRSMKWKSKTVCIKVLATENRTVFRAQFIQGESVNKIVHDSFEIRNQASGGKQEGCFVIPFFGKICF